MMAAVLIASALEPLGSAATFAAPFLLPLPGANRLASLYTASPANEGENVVSDDEILLEYDLEENLECDIEVESEYEWATVSDAEVASFADVLEDATLASPANAWEDYDLATASDAIMLMAAPLTLTGNSSIGDLWEDWSGDWEYSGEGTEEAPYQISTLAELMGLSAQVASGETFADTYFELQNDIDLDFSINSGNWNPIGWYQNRAEADGEISHPFEGWFDGCGYTISGLRLIDVADELTHLGLFGEISGGGVRALTLEAEELTGADAVGLLAGKISGDAIIYDVSVSGYAHSTGDAGGIAAVIDGDGEMATVENCSANGVALYTSGTDSCVGGIGGRVTDASLIDSVVLTQDGESNRIHGKGYIGGIVGYMEDTAVYNAYVDGTIGGNGSAAVGGIVGYFRSGTLAVVRMAGTIGRTNQGTAKREGIYIGTRPANSRLTYGTDKNDVACYLFTSEDNAGKTAVGSDIDGDNLWTLTAHIGYWTDNEKKYVLTAGKTEESCGDRYFYEELEDGVHYIVTQKLSRELTADDYADGLTYHIDHFAPGYMGEPVRGYLVTVETVTAVNANGTLDTDVATLSAIPAVNSTYYRAISKDYTAAIVPGATVTVVTAPKNSGNNRYQMVYDASEPGKVVPPTYTDEEGEAVAMTYAGAGAYTFIMPEADTLLSVEYIKVTTQLTMTPEEMTLSVVQTRSGDRKNPQLVTTVYDNDGKLIARYVGSVAEVTPSPVSIHAEHNGAGDVSNQTVKWSVDMPELLTLTGVTEDVYTDKDAYVMPNLQSSFIQNIINKKVGEQSAGNYAEAIDDTVYEDVAIVTAAANPETSMDNTEVTAHTRMNVTFQIVDNTTRRVEGLNLNYSDIKLTVTRKFTGLRSKPTETITCSQPVVLAAELVPEQPWLKQVTWKDVGSGTLIALSTSGSYAENCAVSMRYDAEGEANPAWIQNVINADNEKWSADPTVLRTGKATAAETVTATSEDQTNGIVSASCQVVLTFVTEDETTLTIPRSSSGGSGGEGGGGGSSGGSSSLGVTTSGATSASGPGLPSYVVTGTWMQNAAARWLFTDNTRTYAGEWAAVHNPYADTSAGQSAYDWFRFDADGFMRTGWYEDSDGKIYYLHPVSDGTLGRMYTGWNWIGNELGTEYCYYFNENTDGFRGALLLNGTAPDGRNTDALGRLIVDGMVQERLPGTEADNVVMGGETADTDTDER